MTTEVRRLVTRATLGWETRAAALDVRLLRRLLWPGVLVLGAAGVLLVNLAGKPAGGGRSVRIAPVRRGPMSLEVLATGAIQAKERLELRYAGEAAEVAAVLVEPGETVEAGRPLVQLATQPLLEAVRRAQSQYLDARYRLADLRGGRREARLRGLELAVERAREELKFQENQWAQMQELARAGLVARIEEARARHDVYRARLGFEQAELELAGERESHRQDEEASLQAELSYRRLSLARAQTALAGASLKAPGRGTLLEAPARPGALLRQGDLVAVLADMRRFRISAPVDEMEVGRLRVGQPVWVRSEFFGASELQGRLERIVPSVRKERGVPSVEVLVAVPEGAWEPPAGLTVDIGVRVEQTGQVTQVPLEAVVERQGRSAVFVYESGRARLQPITVGLRNDAAAEVLTGLTPGQQVVTAGHASLQDGEAVHPATGDSGSLTVEFFR